MIGVIMYRAPAFLAVVYFGFKYFNRAARLAEVEAVDEELKKNSKERMAKFDAIIKGHERIYECLKENRHTPESTCACKADLDSIKKNASELWDMLAPLYHRLSRTWLFFDMGYYTRAAWFIRRCKDIRHVNAVANVLVNQLEPLPTDPSAVDRLANPAPTLMEQAPFLTKDQ